MNVRKQQNSTEQKVSIWDVPLKVPNVLSQRNMQTDYYFTTTGDIATAQLWNNAQIDNIPTWGTTNVGAPNILAQTINLVSLGAAYNKRQSRSILVKRIQANIFIEDWQNYTQTQGTIQNEACNVIIIQFWLDTQYKGGSGIRTDTPQHAIADTFTLLYEPTPQTTANLANTYPQYSPMAWPNRNNEQRFHLIKEIRTTFNMESNTVYSGSGYNLATCWKTPASFADMPTMPAPQCCFHKVDIPNIEIPIIFDDTQTPGSLNTIVSNNIMVTMFNTSLTRDQSIYTSFRITFEQT